METEKQEWFYQLIDLLELENRLYTSMKNNLSETEKLAIQYQLKIIEDKKRAYFDYEIKAVYEILQPVISEKNLMTALKAGSNFSKNRRIIIKRLHGSKAKDDTAFNDFLELLLLFIINKQLAFDTLISSMLFAQECSDTLTYTEDEIITETIQIMKEAQNGK